MPPCASHRAFISLDCGEGLLGKLHRAQDILRQRFPEGKYEDIFEEALESLLDKKDPERIRHRKEIRRQRDAATQRDPMADFPDIGPGRSRYIPQRVRDAVWRRDGGRCAYVGLDKHRCTIRVGLEYDHLIPFGLGGRSNTPENVRLMCRHHNRHLGSRVLTERRIP